VNKITITTANITESESIIEYLKKVMDETLFLRMYADEVNFTVAEEELFINSMNTQDNSHLLIAKDGYKIVAIGSIQGQQLKKFRHCGEFGVSVLKEYWGKGIGKELTNRLIDWAKENPVLKKINLHVNIENKVAIAIYRKIGFRQEGILSKDFYYNNRYVDTLIMGIEV
jgi:RimJ/RimL family protein N-acetyltransferase